MGNDMPAICCPIGKRKTHANGMGVHFTVRGKGSANWQAIYPTEYRCFIKEVSIMRSGCGLPHRGQGPSSVTQLPILTALHARSPTLFFLIIHELVKKVNPKLLFQPGIFEIDEKKRCIIRTPNIGSNPKKFVYFDEKTLKQTGNPLAFCALLLYNNANLLEGGLGSGRTDRNRIR